MITTQQLAKELGTSQRNIQNRILRLRLTVERVGNAFVLTAKQADAIRNYKDARKR